MLRPVPSLLASALLATAALTGCGGGDDGPDRASATTTTTAPAPDGGGAAAFRLAVAEGKTTIGSIGTDVETAIRSADQRSNAELAQQFSALADRTRAALETLRALRAPTDASDELAALRTAVETGATDLQDIATAADRGDVEAATAATKALIAHSPAIGAAGDRLAGVAGVTGADTGADGTSGKITVEYEPPRTKTEKLAQQLLEVGGTDGVAAGFSQRFVLPTDLKIQAVRGFVGPNYDPSTKTVTLSYGFVDYIASVIRRNDPKITDDDLGGEIAAIDGFILVHELGHAFADVFELPLTGREEDSVDQLATVFLVGGVNNGATYAIQAARFFRLLFDDRKALKQSDYWDEHSLSIQRAYDIACLVAGSSEENFDGVRSLGILGRSRLERCPSEWTKIDNAWQTLLKPHLRGS
ncbi:DUF4344 domain-containing metallopeptidase [Patulibacter minatonensis]|uniref:DUF4344 domain-containing metallopeptidase n=1 Tax=Patulibacter minatonensis TaxID=298163 RepID=UPI0012F86A52|nr:DUF4344 domain-containing metallopeptidase [Patulibacter minatonensis]